MKIVLTSLKFEIRFLSHKYKNSDNEMIVFSEENDLSSYRTDHLSISRQKHSHRTTASQERRDRCTYWWWYIHLSVIFLTRQYRPSRITGIPHFPYFKIEFSLRIRNSFYFELCASESRVKILKFDLGISNRMRTLNSIRFLIWEFKMHSWDRIKSI